MELIFLGTSAMVPTKERNHVGIYIHVSTEHILADCGEGIQRQLKQAGIPLPCISKLLISHLDGDHVLGIAGFVQSLAASDYQKELLIIGPPGTKQFLKSLFALFRCKLPVSVKEASAGTCYESEDYLVESRPLKHTVATLGYSIIEKDKRRVDKKKMKSLGILPGPHIGQLVAGKSISFKGKHVKPEDITYVQKGKKITIIMDTLPTPAVIKLADHADVLVCESTFGPDQESKAKEYKHMTSSQAALLAKQSHVHHLILTHFSARYKDVSILEKDAKKTFANTCAAHDFLRVRI